MRLLLTNQELNRGDLSVSFNSLHFDFLYILNIYFELKCIFQLKDPDHLRVYSCNYLIS